MFDKKKLTHQQLPQHVNILLSRYMTKSCLDVTGTDETVKSD